jgi:predicted alpha/beta superfamily hydrolase
MRIQAILGLALVVSSVRPLTGQPSPVTLSGTEEHALHSRILDRDFELYVKLPWSYHRTAEPYPVLFTLDANRTFPLFATISSIFETPAGGGAREVVVVGIAYKTGNDRLEGLVDWATLRQRDFEPEANPEADSALEARLSALPRQEDLEVRSGEADAFLEFLQQEAIPFIEEHYRVSTTDRALAGYSLSGLFVLYTFFKAPGTFSTYLAGDPSMRDILFRLEAGREASDPGPEARILIVTPEGRKAVRRLVDRLQSRGYPGLNVHHEVLADEDHLSGGPAAISRMLRIVHGLRPPS